MHECAQVGVFPGHFPEIIIYIAVGERYFCVRMTHDSPARNSFRSVWRAMPRRFNAGWFGTHTEWGNGRYHSHYYVCTLCVLGRRRNHEHLRLLVLYTNKKNVRTPRTLPITKENQLRNTPPALQWKYPS